MENAAAKLLSLTSKTLSKQDRVAQAASDKRGKLEGYLSAAAQDAGVANNKPLQILGLDQDIEGILNRNAGEDEYIEDSTANRSTGEAIGDSFSSAVDAAVQGVGGIVATGMTVEDLIINKLTGSKENDGGRVFEYLAQAGQDVRDAQSAGIQADRRAQAARNAATADRNLRMQKDEIAKGDGSFVSGLRRVGRDFVDSLSNLDDMGATDVVAAGGGSLLVGGLLGKGLKAAGLGSAAMPAAIGAQEGGAAFTQTYNEMIGKGYSEEQAQKAGMLAAGIQAPVGVITGKLVSKFEMNPLKAVGPTKAVGNILREAVEETSQEASGQLSGNFAENTFGDGTNDMLEGVGEGAAMGLVGGAGIAGVTQGPGAALKGALDIAVKAGAVTKYGLGKINKAISTGIAAVDLANDKASSVFDDNVKPVVQAAIASMGEMATKVAQAIEESQLENEKKLEGKEYLAKLSGAFDFDRSVLDDPNVPEAMRNVLAQTTDRFDAIRNMRWLAEDSEANSPEQRGAVMFIYNEVAELKSLLSQGVDSNLSSLDPKSEAGEFVENIKDALFMIEQSASVRSILKEFDNYAKGMGEAGILDEVSDESIATPEGQQAARDIVTVAEASPLNSTLAGIQSIFRHADNGSINLTPEQRAVMRSTAALLKARAERTSRLEALGLTTLVDVVSEDISTTTETGDKDGRLPSLKEHVQLINGAARNGDKEDAKAYLETLLQFAQHMQNKVEALNKNFESGKWNEKVGYQALMPDRSWKPSLVGINVMPNNKKSLEFAQRIADDATTVGQVANELAGVFGDLGVAPVQLVPLNSELVGPADEVTQKFRDQNKASQLEKAKARLAEQQAKKAAEKPAPKSAADLLSEAAAEPVEVQSTPESKETDQPKGGDTSTEVESEPEPVQEVVQEPEPVVESNPKLEADLLQERLDIMQEMAGIDLSLREANDVLDADLYAEVKEDSEQRLAALKNKLATVNTLLENMGAKIPSAKESREAAGIKVGENAVGQTEIKTVVDPVAEPVVEEVVEPEPEAEVVAEPKTIQEAYPNLIGASKFTKGFKLPTERKTRTQGQASPLAVVREALASREALAKLIGSKLKKPFGADVVEGYRNLLSTAESLKGRLNQRALTALDKKRAKVTVREFLDNAELTVESYSDKTKNTTVYSANMLLSRSNFKALNLLEKREDGFAYNDELIESAILAAIQWVLSADNYRSIRDDKKAAQILSVDESLIPGISIQQEIVNDKGKKEIVEVNPRTFLSAGLTTVEAKRSLAEKIMQYWGLSQNKSAGTGVSMGAAEAIAAELLIALVQDGAVTQQTVKLTGLNVDKDGNVDVNSRNDGLPIGEKRSIDLFTPFKFPENAPMNGYLDAIEQAVMLEAKQDNFFGEPPAEKDFADTQLRRPEVQLPDAQKEAIRFEAAQQHLPNVANINFTMGLKKDQILKLFAAGDINDDVPMNKEDRKSKRGLNLTFASAYDTLQKMMVEYLGAAKEAGVDPVNFPVFYNYNFTSVNRMQMLGLNNPQASKLMRELFLPTRSTIDVSKNGLDGSAFGLALAQALGIKVEKEYRDVATSAVRALLEGDLKKSVENMQAWLQDQDTPFSEEALDQLIKDLGDKRSPVAVHAIMEYARFKNADQAGRAAFETALYVEADGVANGMTNAMALLEGGEFTPERLKIARKGGYFIGLAKMTMNRFFKSIDGLDLYQTMSDLLGIRMAGVQLDAAQESEADRQMKSLTVLMDILMKDIEVTGQDITFKRGASKNPSTITVYGSGAKGIAGNLTNEMITSIYEMLTAALQAKKGDDSLSFAQAMFPNELDPERKLQQMNDALVSLGAVVIRKGKFGLYTEAGLPVSFNKIALDGQTAGDYKVGGNQFQNMQENILQLMIRPMRDVINETIGTSTMSAADLLRKAVQVQSIALQFGFEAAIEKKMAEKAKDPSWDPSDFLSPNELREIFDSLRPLAPLISNGQQNYYIAGKGKLDLGSLEFGNSLDDTMDTGAYVRSPTDASVSGIPATVIGWGDGLMMQLLSTSIGTERTLKIFDGMHMPLDKLSDYSQKANQAVFETWMGNPLKAVSDAYTSFLEAFEGQLDMEAFAAANAADKDNKFARALGIMPFAKPGVEVSPPSDEYILETMKSVAEPLKQAAMEAEARHRAIARFPVSVDQMAGVGAPYQHQGTEDLSSISNLEGAEYDQALAGLLNKAYREELAVLKKEWGTETITEVIESETVETEAETVRSPFENYGRNTKSGARTIGYSALRKLIAQLDPTGTQRELFNEVVKTLTSKEYKVVYGSLEQLEQYAADNGIDIFDARGAQGVNGMTIPHLQTVFLINPTAEVLVHELIHAATVDKLTAHYAGESLGANSKEQVEAIQRLEALLDQFLDFDISNMSSEQKTAYLNAADEIDFHINNGNMAGAVNEFMAWSLANAELETVLKTVPPLVQLARGVIDMIKQLIFGRKRMPKADDNMFAQVRFNTSILLRTKLDARIAFNKTIYFQRTGYGTNDRLVKLNRVLSDKVLRHLTANLKGKTEAVRADELKSEYKQLGFASQIFEDVRKAGFSMDKQEETTFKVLLEVMATSAQLDPNALGAVQKLFEHVTKELKIESFRKNSDINDPNDEAQAKKKYDMLMGETRVDTDKQGRSSLLPVFLALSTTNEELRGILSKMNMPENQRTGDKTVDGLLSDGANSLMDSLTMIMSGQGIKPTSVRAAMDNLLDRIQETAEEREIFMGAMAVPGQVVDTLNDKAVGAVQKFANFGQRKAAELKASNSTPLAQGFAKGLNALAGMLDETLAEDQAEGLLSAMNRAKMPAPLVKLITDMVGRVPSNAEVYDMIKQVRGWVQQKRQQFREKLPRLINEKFNRAVTKAEWNEMFNALGKTDFAALKNVLTLDQMFALVQDPTTTAALIEKLEAELNAMDPNAQLMIEKAKQLAVFMNTGVTGINLLRNANAISALINMGVQNRTQPTEALVRTVDVLTSLYAFDMTSDVTKNTLSVLAQTEKEGIVFTMNMLVGRRNEELAKTKTGNAFLNHYKGHMPTEFSSDASLVVAEDFGDTSRELLKRGYKRTGDYVGSNLDRGVNKRGYYLAPVSGKAPFSQGLFQNARTTASGVDPVTGFTNDMTAGRITDPATVLRIARNQSKEKATEALLPVFNNTGNVVAYERSVDPAQFEQLDRNTNLAEVIGIWRGRQHEEIESQQVNGALIANLFNMWVADTDSGLNKMDEYLDLNDPKVMKQYPLLADAMSLLTPATRIQIKNQFPGNEFYVRKDMLDDALGYRAASIADLYGDNAGKIQKQVRDIAVAVAGNEAYEWMVKGERVLQNLVTDARVLIVVKSVVVPMTNLVANIYQLWSRGVPMADIARAMPKKTAEINMFVKNRELLDQLEAELLAAEGANSTVDIRKIKIRMQTINDDNRRMSIWPLIEAGEFSAISDGTVDRNDSLLTEGKLGNYIENMVDKLPQSVKTAGRYAIISRDTALFQGLQKAVEYGDFLGKAVLYDHLTKTERAKTLGKIKLAPDQTPDDGVKAYALGRITEEFVNYDRLPGRFRGYMESIGLIWFYNFKIRATKIGLSMMRNNPLHVMLSMGLPDIAVLGAVGTPVNESLGALMLKDGLAPSIGPGMGWNAASLHPYVAALN